MKLPFTMSSFHPSSFTISSRAIMLHRLTKHKRILFFVLLVVAALLLAACGAGGPAPTPTPTKTPVAAAGNPHASPTPVALPMPTPTPEPPTPTPRPENIAPFTGLPVDDPERIKQLPIFVCVNNDAAGRAAHWGLSKADLVYEYIVDGFSLTRLTAMYQSQEADRIGPVRSARYPNIWMVQMYGGVLACSGGSDAIRYLLKNEVGFPYLDADIDDPSNNRYFTNLGTDYRTRLQARTDGVRQWLADKGIPTEWNKPGFEFSEEPPSNPAGEATVIDIPYPGGNSVQWRYDPALGGYLRYQGGVPQFDPAINGPIVASNVIVLAAVHEVTDIIEDTLGTKGINIKLHEFGDLRIFRDGKVYEGTWRASQEAPPRWLGPGEVPITLKPGQSWVQVVRKIEDISYQ
ncbi:DUF3048 domain-containing protein [Caldilinea sp.]|uniref:DUF3048 domain-containing protein n=1 Tax=Caldilinea sp. TaxID=2293560 RepID=UPI002625E0C3|nr:DUF3048 domain-containing protein [uncultured Caldilinea sp.]